MRVIDAHVHTWTRDIISKKDLEARRIAAEREGTEPQFDSPIENLRVAMDKASIEKAVILPIDSGLNQDMPLSLKEKTDWHANEVSGDSNIITFVGLDPRRGDEGLAELERAVTEKGCRGWKMYPPNGFYPDEMEFYPYYELCTNLEIPIMVHTGFTSRFKHIKYGQPIYLDKVAADFPKLRIVIAHVGVPWVDEAITVAAKNPNVLVDVSGWQAFASRMPHRVYKMVADAKLMRVFPNKMLWGSDFPLFEYAMPLEQWLGFFANLKIPKSLLDMGYSQVTKDEIEVVMWKNAALLFFGEKP
ncbi:MAG: amidohydrolase [Candidatus Thorarchaeota archaeon]|nr:MAG: amidohydrolase [Candidatus Thorarchaeota archaeon]